MMVKTNRVLFCFVVLLHLTAATSVSFADADSDVWQSLVVGPVDGAFGTNGSVSGNTLMAEIITGSTTATVSLTASNENWFKLNGTTPSGTNNQLVPFLENDAPLTELSFFSDVPLTDVDLLLHNVWNATDGAVPGGQRSNYIGNFRVTYADGTVDFNALPSVRVINDDSPFAIDFEGQTLQPTGLGDAFDGGNILSSSESEFEPGNGADPAYYWSDLSQSMMSEMQGFGIFSFEESNGGITGIDFTWVGNTVGTNTAFLGVAGEANPEVTSIPEPGGLMAMFLIAISSIVSRQRRFAR